MARPRKSERDETGTKSWRKWSPKAWLSDLQVQLCSLEAKGLWIDMLNLMMESPRVGYLLGPDGKQMDAVQLSTIVRAPVDNVSKLLDELKKNRVFSVNNRGIIFNRRIVREEIGVLNSSKAGSKSVENRERDQQGRLKPWANAGAKSPTRDRDRDRYKKEEGNPPDNGRHQAPRAKPKPKRQWTLDERREYAWKKVAEAIGSDGWGIVESAAAGNYDAKRLCKSTAKDIGVTWIDGKPEVTNG